MNRELEIDVAASAMFDSAQMAKRSDIRIEDCRVLARIALDAVQRARETVAVKDFVEGVEADHASAES